ncbi:MAG: acyl-CoA thioesterase [Moraxellaceae bacterium]|nr:acyl-CoA thioesterase [Pseudomonadales bacterium]MCP5173767.1 acyl-CoA thioesterase [Moraxellaceae bacterium]MCP5176914.1 acyl-CoA thioesterase [Moraxellaceae bacterium]
MNHLNNFPIVQAQMVAWGEMDAFAHVNNVAYYRYFESVRISYLQTIGALEHLDVCNPVVAANSCRYLKSIRYPDELEIGARVVELRSSGFRMEYAIFSQQHKSIVATGEAIVVIVDAQGQKVSLPEELKQTIINLEKTVGNELESDAQNPHKPPETLLGKAISRLNHIRDK